MKVGKVDGSKLRRFEAKETTKSGSYSPCIIDYMYMYNSLRPETWKVVKGGRDMWSCLHVERSFLLQCDKLMRKASGKGSRAKQEVIPAFYVSNEPGAQPNKPNKQSAMYV